MCDFTLNSTVVSFKGSRTFNVTVVCTEINPQPQKSIGSLLKSFFKMHANYYILICFLTCKKSIMETVGQNMSCI